MMSDKKLVKMKQFLVLAVCIWRLTEGFVFSVPGVHSRLQSTKIDSYEVDGTLKPLSQYLLIQVDEGRAESSGGVLLAKTEKSPTGTVIQVGPGQDDKETGIPMPMSLKVGDKVLWGRYDGAQMDIDGESHTLLRERDVRLAWTGDSRDPLIDTVRVIGRNILLKLTRSSGETATGIIISNKDDEIPLEGTIIAKGDGAFTRQGEQLPLDFFEIGDCVKFRDFDTTEVKIQNEDYVVIDSANCICKWKPLKDSD